MNALINIVIDVFLLTTRAFLDTYHPTLHNSKKGPKTTKTQQKWTAESLFLETPFIDDFSAACPLCLYGSAEHKLLCVFILASYAPSNNP